MVGKQAKMTADPGAEKTPLTLNPSVAEAAAVLANFEYEGPKPDGLLDVITAAHVADHMRFIERAGQYEDGSHQTNSDHSFRLGFMVLQVATSQRPDLDAPHAFMLSFVHDLPEVHGDDTPINDEEKLETKELREAAGLAILIAKDLAGSKYMADLLKEYKDLKTPEARFVYGMDKFEPVSFALRTQATTQRLRGDDFPEQVESQLPKTIVDPTAFQLMVRGYRELGRRWEEWGCKPFEGTADEIVDRVVKEVVGNREDLLEHTLHIPEGAELPDDEADSPYRTH
jgi:5'-deoxynucleotidase YfbR-like HD superfamily hydrolase